MRRTVIRYRTKPDMADRNAELVAAVFAEPRRTHGLRRCRGWTTPSSILSNRSR